MKKFLYRLLVTAIVATSFSAYAAGPKKMLHAVAKYQPNRANYSLDDIKATYTNGINPNGTPLRCSVVDLKSKTTESMNEQLKNKSITTDVFYAENFDQLLPYFDTIPANEWEMPLGLADDGSFLPVTSEGKVGRKKYPNEYKVIIWGKTINPEYTGNDYITVCYMPCMNPMYVVPTVQPQQQTEQPTEYNDDQNLASTPTTVAHDEKHAESGGADANATAMVTVDQDGDGGSTYVTNNYYTQPQAQSYVPLTTSVPYTPYSTPVYCPPVGASFGVSASLSFGGYSSYGGYSGGLGGGCCSGNYSQPQPSQNWTMSNSNNSTFYDYSDHSVTIYSPTTNTSTSSSTVWTYNPITHTYTSTVDNHSTTPVVIHYPTTSGGNGGNWGPGNGTGGPVNPQNGNGNGTGGPVNPQNGPGMNGSFPNIAGNSGYNGGNTGGTNGGTNGGTGGYPDPWNPDGGGTVWGGKVRNPNIPTTSSPVSRATYTDVTRPAMQQQNAQPNRTLQNSGMRNQPAFANAPAKPVYSDVTKTAVRPNTNMQPMSPRPSGPPSAQLGSKPSMQPSGSATMSRPVQTNTPTRNSDNVNNSQFNDIARNDFARNNGVRNNVAQNRPQVATPQSSPTMQPAQAPAPRNTNARELAYRQPPHMQQSAPAQMPAQRMAQSMPAQRMSAPAPMPRIQMGNMGGGMRRR